MSARQRQQQQQLLHEFDNDEKAAEYPTAGEPPSNDVTNYAASYNQPPRMTLPAPCAVRESYVDHVTSQKSSTTPSLNGSDGGGYSSVDQ